MQEQAKPIYGDRNGKKRLLWAMVLTRKKQELSGMMEGSLPGFGKPFL